MSGTDLDRQISLQELWGILWRGRWIMLAVTTGVIAVVMALTFALPRSYESEAVLQVRTDDPGSGLLGSMGELGDLADLGGISSLGRDEVDTEMGLIRSRRITGAVVDSLGLNVELESPDRPRREFLRVLATGRDTVEGRYTLTRIEGGSYRLRHRGRRPNAAYPDRVAVGEPFWVGNVELMLEPALASGGPHEIRFRIHSFLQTLEDLREEVKVDRQRSGSQLVEITYRERDPAMAAAVVNGIVDHYVDFRERTNTSDARLTIEVLREQVARYQRDLRAAEEALQSYQEAQRIIAPEEQATQQVRRIAEVQAANDAMVVERRALAGRLRTIAQRSEAEPGRAYRDLATFPSFLANEGVQNVLATLTELENDRAELLTLRTERNTDVRQLDARIDELEAELFRLGTNYLESLDTQIASAGTTLAAFGAELEAVPAREIEYARRLREQKLLSEVYVALQARLKQAEVQEAIEPEKVRVIDEGFVPDEPVFPKPLVNLVLALVLGGMLGTATVVGREMTTTKIRSRADAEGATAGLPVLGVIPRAELAPQRLNGSHAPRGIRIPGIPVRTVAEVGGELLVARRDPWSTAAEAYRGLATNLSLAGGAEGPRVIVLTSAHPGDGSAAVAGNLALALAQQGAPTLLVDADLRAGVLHDITGAAAAPGLTDVLTGDGTMDDAAHPVEGGSGLRILPIGRRPDRPGELLASERLSGLLRSLREHYRFVILHAPALDLATDAALLGTLADTTLIVARSGATERAALEQAATVLRRLGVAVGGIVLNDAPERRRTPRIGHDAHPPPARAG